MYDAGGIAGYIIDGTIENCWNKGNVTATYYAGGIIAVSVATVKNCYNSGTITAFGNYCGGISGINYGSISNCYYLESLAYTASDGTSKKTDAFQSGEVTWLLNGNSSDGVWKQTLGTDTYPNFTGLAVVYNSEEQKYYNKSPKPVFTTSQTTSSITLNLSNYNLAYGTVQYSLDAGTTWNDFEITGEYTITDLNVGTDYTVYVRYAGQGIYLESNTEEINVETGDVTDLTVWSNLLLLSALLLVTAGIMRQRNAKKNS